MWEMFHLKQFATEMVSIGALYVIGVPFEPTAINTFVGEKIIPYLEYCGIT